VLERAARAQHRESILQLVGYADLSEAVRSSCGLGYVFIQPERINQRVEVLVPVDFAEAPFGELQAAGDPAFRMVVLVPPAADPADMTAQNMYGISDDIGAQKGLVQG
jgi:hypothetical protein